MAIYFARAVDSSSNFRGFKSTNGTTWSIGSRGNFSQSNVPLVYNEQISYMLEFGTGSVFRVFLSTNGGTSYTQQSVNCVTNNQSDLPLDGSRLKLSNGMMTITSTSGVYASTNLFGKINETTGALPTQFKNAYTSQMPFAQSMHYSPITDLIYIGNGGSDAGIHVINAANGIKLRSYSVAGTSANGYVSFSSFQHDASLGIVPGGGTNGADLVYAVDGFYGMRKSLDSGATWTGVINNFPSGFNPKCIHVDGANLLVTGWVSSDYGKAVFSSNGGATWSTIKNIANITSGALTDIEKIGNTYFVSGSSTGTHKSTDNGNTWSTLNTISYNSITYTIMDIEGFAASNSAPTAIVLSSSTIAENAGANAVVGTISATDAEGGTMTYALVAGAGSTDNTSFIINGTNLQLANGISLDYETKSSYSVRIQATDEGGLTYSQAFTISVLNANEAPTNITLSNLSVDENQLSGTTVGTLSTTDPDAGNTFTYSLSGTDASSFVIDGNVLKTAASFDRETKSSMSISITSTDQNGLAFTKAFTISVNNVNEAPTNITLSASSIMENNAVNAVIGTLSVTDPDVGDSVVFSVISGGDKFDVSGTSLRAKVPFNYEAATSHSVTVRATDAGGLSYDKSFTISVTNDVGDDSVVLTESTSITLSDGKVYAEITIDPRVMPVTQADGSPLPEGSVLKNASSGQKYYKLTNSPASGSATTNFVAIELVPPEEWGWSEAAAAAWEVLQGF